jgi:type II secretory pathway pseudopilin PulG
MGIRNANRSGLEKIILLIIFLGLLGFVAANFFKQRELAKQQALYHQLVILRQGINMFQMTERRNPESLIELAMASYKIQDDGATHRYVETVKVDDKAQVVDPFDNPYNYDKQTGWVRSSTPGFMDW